MNKRMTVILAAIILVLSGAPTLAQQPNLDDLREYRQPGQTTLEPSFGGEEIRVQLWSDQSSYYLGSQVTICFRVSHDSYFYLYSTDPAGMTRQIFPNAYDRSNYLRAGETYCIPDRSYQLLAVGPPGIETLYGIASGASHQWLNTALDGANEAQNPYPVIRQDPETLYQRIEQDAQTDSDQAVPLEIQPTDHAYGRAFKTVRILENPYRQQYNQPAYNAPGYGYGYAPGPYYGANPPYQPPPRYAYQQQRPQPRPEPTPRPQPRRDYDDYEPRRPPYYIPEFPPPYYYPQRGGENGEEGERGTIEISSSPDYADVYIDQVYWGRTPFEVQLPTGEYRVEVRKRGYETWQREVRISANRRASFTFRLDSR